MLSQIRGITKKTAEIILKTIQFKELLNGNIMNDEISNIQISNIQKFGDKKTHSIIKYFVKK